MSNNNAEPSIEMNNRPYQLSVLLVDSDPFDRRSIVKTLAQIADEVQISECRSGAEAFEMLVNHNFDIALVCQELPDELGTDLLQRLRQAGRMQVPIILLTETDDLGEEVIRMGAHEFLSNETRSVQHFKKAIRYSVERQRLWQELAETKLREQRERELRMLESSQGEVAGAAANTLLSEQFEKDFKEYCTEYARIFDVFIQDNSFKREKISPEQIKDLAASLGKIGAGPKELVRIHRTFLEALAFKDRLSKRDESLTSEARYFLLQLMGELVVFYRDKTRTAE